MNIPDSEKKVLADFKYAIPELTEWKRYARMPRVGFFAENGHITRLTLRGLNLTELPNSIGNFKELRELLLDSNYLSSLPESFQNLTNLEVLQLERNNFTLLPIWIGNLKNLRVLFLGDNKFRTLFETIGNLENLRELDLGRYNFTSLPEWFGNLKNLTCVYLGPNKISVLPESFKNLKKFAWIGLEDAGLRSFSNIPQEFIDQIDPFEDCLDWECFSSKGNYPSKHAKETIGLDENIYDIWDYYCVSPLELAAKYAKDQNSLIPHEKDRLAWEGGFRERQLIEEGGVEPDDFILAEINKRLVIKCDNGLELIK